MKISPFFGLILLSLICVIGCTTGSTWRVMNPDCNAKHGFCYRPPDKSTIKAEYNHPRMERLAELEPVVYGMLGTPASERHGGPLRCGQDIVSYVAEKAPKVPVYDCIDIRLIQKQCTEWIIGAYLLNGGQPPSPQTNDFVGEQTRRVEYSNLFLQEYAVSSIQEAIRQAREKRTFLIIGFLDDDGIASLTVLNLT